MLVAQMLLVIVHADRGLRDKGINAISERISAGAIAGSNDE